MDKRYKTFTCYLEDDDKIDLYTEFNQDADCYLLFLEVSINETKEITMKLDDIPEFINELNKIYLDYKSPLAKTLNG